MAEFVQFCFSWPVLPASVLLCVVTAYWLLVILGAAELDFGQGHLHFDFDAGLDGHGSLLDWGLASLKWLNLGDVPLMVWLSACAFPAWVAAITLDRSVVDPTTAEIIKAGVRNFAIGVVAAKLLTQPLKGKLKFVEPNPAPELIGRIVTITSSTASPNFGQAQLATHDGAPLQLHVRTLDGTIEKGREARIVEYAAATRLYYVEQIDRG